jgi:hypothetical protein
MDVVPPFVVSLVELRPLFRWRISRFFSAVYCVLLRSLRETGVLLSSRLPLHG